MSSAVDSSLAKFLADHPTATMREAGEHGMKIVTGMVNEGKFQESADFIHAWMTKFPEASRARSAGTVGSPMAQAAAAIERSSQSSLPTGISGGKVAAIVAAVGLAVGAYALLREKREPATLTGKPVCWTQLVDQRRTLPRSEQFPPR